MQFRETAFVNLDPSSGKEHRPWNPYWCVFETATSLYEAGARPLLDVGCGAGTYAAILAYIGYDVSGFDVSPMCVDTARELAVAHHVSERCHFSTQVAERP